MGSRMCLQDTVTVGSKSNSDLQVSSSNIAGEHAEIFQKGGRTYCKATAGDEEDMTSSSYTWLDSSESQLRTGDHLLYGSDSPDSFTGRYACVIVQLQGMKRTSQRAGTHGLTAQNLTCEQVALLAYSIAAVAWNSLNK